MIIKYYKGYVSLEHLKEMLNINKNGTTAYDIVNTSRKLGFKSDCYYVEFSNFNDKNIIFPCIANVVIDNKYKHFIVINEINFKKKFLIISDPASKVKKIFFEEFAKIYNNYLIILYPQKTIPILDNERINLRDLLKIIITNKSIIKHISILSIFITIFSVLSSFYIEYLINAINYSNSINVLKIIFLVFLFIFILKNISELFRNKLLVIINQKIDLVLTFNTYYNILSLPYHYYRNRTTGDIVSRMNDLGNIKDTISKLIILLVVDLPLTLFSLTILLLINSTLFLIALIILIFYILVVIIFRKIIENNILDIQQSKSDITSKMVESICGFETVKGLKIKNYIYTGFKNIYCSFLNKNYKFQNTYLFENFMKNIINDIGFVVITFIGTTLVLQNKLSLGELLSFNALIVYFLDPIKNVLSFDIDINQAKCSIKRINELNIKKKEEKVVSCNLKGNIEYHNLTYSYGYNKPILKNINLVINCGEKVLFLGPSGSGKSTLLKLLMKYYDVSRNKIFIDGVDINDFKNNKNIKYINQIETLFTDSLYNNLVLDNNIDDEKFNRIIEMCKLKSIIDKDNLGLNQLIEENGFNLSGGERQRIVLARTLLSDFDILIIDEGLNQIDTDLEKEILNDMINYFKDKTIIVISHRINNKELYQKVIYLNNGELKYE